MPLKPISELMADASHGGYAVGYFESWNLESLQGVLDAAEQTRSPIIIGFNGEFLSLPDRRAPERLGLYAAMGRAAAEQVSVPCGFIFNECANDEWTRAAVTAGFNMVMPADAEASHDEYLERTRSICDYAHQHGVAVQAELGELPCGASGAIDGGGALTDPQQAAEFVEATQVDLLAVSVGNVHIVLDGTPSLDLDHLHRIRERVPVPLVLHGGTGISRGDLHASINGGVRMVHYGTYLKQRYLAAMRKALASGENNPHLLLGMGSGADVMVATRLAVREAVLERIEDLGCTQKA